MENLIDSNGDLSLQNRAKEDEKKEWNQWNEEWQSIKYLRMMFSSIDSIKAIELIPKERALEQTLKETIKERQCLQEKTVEQWRILENKREKRVRSENRDRERMEVTRRVKAVVKAEQERKRNKRW